MNWLLGALMVVQLADARTTLLSGGHEMNPIMRPLVSHPIALYGVKAGVGGFTIWTTKKVAQKHPRGAKWLALGIIAGESAVIIHNLKVSHK